MPESIRLQSDQLPEQPQVVTPFAHGDADLETALDQMMADRGDALARPRGLRIRDIEDSTHRVPVVVCRPTLTANMLDLMSQGARALILVTYATGTAPHWLAPVIKKLVDNGAPVFLVSDNPGDETGITELRYEACMPAIEAGAIPIEKVNIGNLNLVRDAIIDAADKLSGPYLGSYIKIMFAYQEGEKKPKPEWERPEAVAKYREEILLPFLRRLGYGEFGIKLMAKRWETNPRSGLFRHPALDDQARSLLSQLTKLETDAKAARERNPSAKAPKGLRKTLRIVKAEIRKAFSNNDGLMYPFEI